MLKKLLSYWNIIRAVYFLAHKKQLFCSWGEKKPFDFPFDKLTITQSFFFDTFSQKLEKLIYGLDQKSLYVIWKHITAAINYQSMRRKPFFFDLYPFFDEENLEKVRQEPCLAEKEAQKLNLPKKMLIWEHSSVYFHHGLKFMPQSVLDYIKEKAFIDAGAYHGESAAVLARYNPAKIYAFEISDSNIHILESNLSKSSISDDLIQIVPMGLGNTEGKVAFDDTQDCSCSLLSQSSGVYTKADVTTLDSFSRTVPFKIGFIKADIEGFGFEMAKGMVATLKRDRPVLYLCIYHNTDEFWEIKPFIESLNLNYHFEIRHYSVNWLSEVVLIGCPAELLQTDQLLNP